MQERRFKAAGARGRQEIYRLAVDIRLRITDVLVSSQILKCTIGRSERTVGWALDDVVQIPAAAIMAARLAMLK